MGHYCKQWRSSPNPNPNSNSNQTLTLTLTLPEINNSARESKN